MIGLHLGIRGERVGFQREREEERGALGVTGKSLERGLRDRREKTLKPFQLLANFL